MKKNIVKCLAFLLALILINPVDTKALESSQDIKCHYVYEQGNTELEFTLNKNEVKLPFKNGTKNNNKNWYFSNKFTDDFFASSKKSSKNVVCPTITIEETDLFITVFNNVIDNNNCNGVCTKLNAKENSVKTTVMANNVAIYNSKEYILPLFRQMSDNSLEWSIDSKKFYSINKSITAKDGSVFKVNQELAKKIIDNLENKFIIYRCVEDVNGKLIYTLTDSKASCSRDLSSVDGQGSGSKHYMEQLGEEYTCSSLLGNVGDDESVAWLLKKILDYLKVLGPLVVLLMSSVDFAKAMYLGDDDMLQKCYKNLFRRLVLAVVLFFVPTLTMTLLGLFGFTDSPLCGLE